MFNPPESWVWDMWFADDGERHHMFFLHASRALHEPDDRHYRASIGHAVSDDLCTWTRVTDALVRSDVPKWDDLATWTGSVTRGDDGQWYLAYTGSTLTPRGNVQRIGIATSPDLMEWERLGDEPVLEAEPQWYEKLADEQWHDEAFRDPWLVRDPGGDGWHMLITARANHGAADDRGVIGHATSPDLRQWTLQPPLTGPGEGFAQLEVMQVEQVDGQWVLLFSCLGADLSLDRRQTVRGGVWAAPADSPVGPFHLDRARVVVDDRLYSGRLARRRDGQWMLLGFRHTGEDGQKFVGGVADPVPVHWDAAADRLVMGG